MTLEEYFGDWLRVIDRRELDNVLRVVSTEYSKKPVCPNQSDIFKAFELCPYKKLRAVFIGQDPYPQKGVATGILFGNKKEVIESELSPSLKIIRESVINFEVPHNCFIFDQTLESWARQGILMINSAMTVEMNKIGSHVMIWRPFIASLLRNLSQEDTSIIYVLFGKQAQTFEPYINKQFNYLLKEDHPAYFARVKEKMPSLVFTKTKELIKGIYGESIDWYEEH